MVRDTDCVARYGGEEFIVILPGLGSTGARQIGERIISRLRDCNHPVAGGTVVATASLGLATHHPGCRFDSAAKLLEAADRAVYAAKRQGRNRLMMYDDAEAASSDSMTVKVGDPQFPGSRMSRAV